MSQGRNKAGILSRYARMLEAIAAAPEPVTLTEIVNATGLPRGSAHRLLTSLQTVGFVTPVGQRKLYKIGPRLLRLCHSTATPASIAGRAKPILSLLSDRFSATAFLARMRGLTVESVASVAPTNEYLSYVQPGRILPAHAAASAKAIVAFQDEELIEQFLALPRQRFTEMTTVSEEGLRAEFREIQREGFATCEDELDPGVLSYACPMYLSDLGVIYSVGIVGLGERLSAHSTKDMVDALKEAANELAVSLSEGPARPVLADALVSNRTASGT